MRNNVAVDSDGKLWDTYTEVQYDDGRAPQPALVVGAQVRLKSERFELYYLFPLAPHSRPWMCAARAGHRRVPAGDPARRGRLAGHPPGGYPGADGPADRG